MCCRVILASCGQAEQNNLNKVKTCTKIPSSISKKFIVGSKACGVTQKKNSKKCIINRPRVFI